MAKTAQQTFRNLNETAELIDLRDYSLPMCDAGASFSHPQVTYLKQKIEQEAAIIVAVLFTITI
ncbi:MAG: hypothetical protein J7L94_08170 [Caldisericaceae bacterium]|nr:hypothetical protein [Caldisericaceae bacterium]